MTRPDLSFKAGMGKLRPVGQAHRPFFKFSWSTVTLPDLHAAWDCSGTAIAELSRCERGPVAGRARSSLCLALEEI